MQTSKRYSDPGKQIEAGYFWLSLGLAISLVIALVVPQSEARAMIGFIGYGLFHVAAGKRNRKMQERVPGKRDSE